MRAPRGSDPAILGQLSPGDVIEVITPLYIVVRGSAWEWEHYTGILLFLGSEDDNYHLFYSPKSGKMYQYFIRNITSDANVEIKMVTYAGGDLESQEG